MALVLVEDCCAVGTITLNHLSRRNALGAALTAELVAALDHLRTRLVRAVVLRAMPGVKVWSAGHDIDELATTPRDPLGWSEPLRSLVRLLQEFPAPVLALVEGGVWGGACEVVFACDIINAAPDVEFAITPARLGVPYNVAGLACLSKVLPPVVVREMMFTARPVGVERLWQLGAVGHVVPADHLAEFTFDMARTIAANAPIAISAMKESLRILNDAHGMAQTQFERLQELRRQVGESDDYREGLAAFAERRPPVFRGRAVPGSAVPGGR
ncbi:MAG: methylmalonyl-CoA decarboxylase [Rhodospirillaceae bacterium]